ncbi:MAG: serine hydrolase domain-containing protein [Bacteroidia bacterium]
MPASFTAFARLASIRRQPATSGQHSGIGLCGIWEGGNRWVLGICGVRQWGSPAPATLEDNFRIGAVTKIVTSAIAARLVHEGVVNWEMKFMDAFPEWEADCHRAYRSQTLNSLLRFRNWLPPFGYFTPMNEQFDGDAQAQRMAFANWAIRQAPQHLGKRHNSSNLSYVLAGALLERASGRTMESLFLEFAHDLSIQVGFGQPNVEDAQGLRGHDSHLQPDQMKANERLNWLMAAGNLYMRPKDLAICLQAFLNRRIPGLDERAFELLLSGTDPLEMGWTVTIDSHQHRIATALGNPGTFLCRIALDLTDNRGSLVMANCLHGRAERGTEAMLQALLAYRK